MPSFGRNSPVSVLSSVDLPAPFGPTTASFWPRSTTRSTSRSTTVPSYPTSAPCTSATTRDDRRGSGNPNRVTSSSRSGSSMRSSFSSVLMRLCTWRAFVAL